MITSGWFFLRGKKIAPAFSALPPSMAVVLATAIIAVALVEGACARKKQQTK